MKLIPLTKGQFAQVDDEDFDYLNQFKWRCVNNYAVREDYAHIKKGGNGKTVSTSIHREILKAADGQIIDHIDRNGLNCQKSNLRFANRSQNGANRKSTAGSTSKYLGVHFDKWSGKWRAAITYNKKCLNLGRFNCEVEAAKKYNEAAIEYHGEFANLNNV